MSLLWQMNSYLVTKQFHFPPVQRKARVLLFFFPLASGWGNVTSSGHWKVNRSDVYLVQAWDLTFVEKSALFLSFHCQLEAEAMPWGLWDPGITRKMSQAHVRLACEQRHASILLCLWNFGGGINTGVSADPIQCNGSVGSGLCCTSHLVSHCCPLNSLPSSHTCPQVCFCLRAFELAVCGRLSNSPSPQDIHVIIPGENHLIWQKGFCSCD